MKKIATLLSILLLVFAILPFTSLQNAQAKEKDLLISTKEELIAFAESVNSGTSYKGKTVRQTADIDLGNTPFTPIGVFGGEKYFLGTYNGQGYTISNLNIPVIVSHNNGLFGMLGGTVINVGIESGEIHGSCLGSITSHTAPGYSATIINCYSKAKLFPVVRAGGIVDNYAGRVINCWYYNEETPFSVVGYACTTKISCYEFKERTLSTNEQKQKFVNKINSSLPKIMLESNLSKSTKLNKYEIVDGNIEFSSKVATHPTFFSKDFLSFYKTEVILASVLVVATIAFIAFFIYVTKTDKKSTTPTNEEQPNNK